MKKKEKKEKIFTDASRKRNKEEEGRGRQQRKP